MYKTSTAGREPEGYHSFCNQNLAMKIETDLLTKK